MPASAGTLRPAAPLRHQARTPAPGRVPQVGHSERCIHRPEIGAAAISARRERSSDTSSSTMSAHSWSTAITVGSVSDSRVAAARGMPDESRLVNASATLPPRSVIRHSVTSCVFRRASRDSARPAARKGARKPHDRRASVELAMWRLAELGSRPTVASRSAVTSENRLRVRCPKHTPGGHPRGIGPVKCATRRAMWRREERGDQRAVRADG